jgi:uncharacterized membrane protein
MDWQVLHNILVFIQHLVSIIGILVIIIGVIYALYRYLYTLSTGAQDTNGARINTIRLDLGRAIILGLEFIVASDLIGTTTTPDYYAVGLLAIIVVIRTVLSFSISREIASITKEQIS